METYRILQNSLIFQIPHFMHEEVVGKWDKVTIKLRTCTWRVKSHLPLTGHEKQSEKLRPFSAGIAFWTRIIKLCCLSGLSHQTLRVFSWFLLKVMLCKHSLCLYGKGRVRSCYPEAARPAFSITYSSLLYAMLNSLPTILFALASLLFPMNSII